MSTREASDGAISTEQAMAPGPTGSDDCVSFPDTNNNPWHTHVYSTRPVLRSATVHPWAVNTAEMKVRSAKVLSESNSAQNLRTGSVANGTIQPDMRLKSVCRQFRDGTAARKLKLSRMINTWVHVEANLSSMPCVRVRFGSTDTRSAWLKRNEPVPGRSEVVASPGS
jgi:hypothetical protein